MFYLFNGFVDHSKRPGAIGQPAACWDVLEPNDSEAASKQEINVIVP